MSDDLIERLEFCAKMHPAVGYPENGKLFSEAAARIRELESANYRITEERDNLRARLAAAEADALERAARVLSRASDEIRALKPKASE